ncbi:MAG: hypothetical protein A3I44_00895 [Candidatus Sungbacteria bacterium RIFCSPLOWO2_02_FULL_51_17]|uniref:Uncharacterized protein n=1 Tax=Candidatus Sungbacteria bacterium RIFCSPHIGHO2_02_FULL_51_29 TaxID=1802273 RepID=A0A1G2KXD5_9BACT|nr:MAG: hypothetical protein A3C16_04240 [Candidatus Sungbacteria bacterium RIFCSPHIGHO2_02_FULL_51_29]OHA10678.1 MAG: hypothetical protein A3I44_00895 [Candidatus Sungbacteria bacterium RIFCSPLOWO2_02_FULL_51_17]
MFFHKKSRRESFARRLFLFATAFLVLFFISAGILVSVIVYTLPDPSKISAQEVVESTKIYDRTKTHVLYDIHGEEKRTVIPFREIPDAVKHATIAIEDSDFYNHKGFDFRGILRALWVDITTGSLSQGGSTITQQLVKKSFLGDERTFTRKIKELILALRLESRYSKDYILELYLNKIPYGSNAYGIEAASKTFFGKSAKDLTLAEAALLTSLPKGTTYYSPYGNHAAELMVRKNAILERMHKLGYITKEEEKVARDEELHFLNPKQNIQAPHLVMMAREYLNQTYGEELVESGGLEVTTTIDIDLQLEAERIIKEGVELNKKLIAAENAALVAIDPKTGEILTLVGSYDYFDLEHDGNYNVATALRQPGSSFKPFVYAAAFKLGYTPETTLFDVPTEFNPSCAHDGKPQRAGISEDECYHPQNYDETFRGPVSLRQSIAQSLNVPSVKLLYLTGVKNTITTAEDVGISTLQDAERCGLALVLGCAEVRLLDMVSAYGVFANDGIRVPPSFILKVERRGTTLEERRVVSKAVIDTNVVRTLNGVLSDNTARIPVFRPNSSLFFPDHQVAAKTGTSQEYRDAWTVGYTPSIAVGIWVGNNDNTPIQQKGSGVLAAAPMWRSFMDVALKKMLPESFPSPDVSPPEKPILRGLWEGDTVVKIDTASKKRATEYTPKEFIKEIAVGQPHTILYWIKKSDPLGPSPIDPRDDPQFKNWEDSFQSWFLSSGRIALSPDTLPKEYDNIHTEQNKPRISLTSFTQNASSYLFDIVVLSPFQIKQIDVFRNDEVTETFSFPQQGVIHVSIPTSEVLEAHPAVEVVVYDVMGNRNALIIPEEKFISPS